MQIKKTPSNAFQRRIEPATRLFNDLWSRLTSPSPKLTGISDQRTAKLASSFLFIILFFNMIGGMVRISRLGFADVFLGGLGFSLVSSLAAYILSRTRWYRASIFLFSISFSVTAYNTILFQGSEADFSLLVLTYVPLSLIVVSSFLSGWTVFLLTGINVALMFSTRLFGIPVPNGFSAMTTITTVTGLVLIALTNLRNNLENDRIAEVREVNRNLENLTATLEQRVAERTRNLELAVEVGRAVSQVRDLDEMLREACELILQDFNLYYVQVYFMDSVNNELVLQAGTGSAARQLLKERHRLSLDVNSINGRAALQKRPVIVSNTEKDAAFKPNPLLPDTRSEMAIPLLAGESVVGILDMQSNKTDALRQELLPAFEALVGQLSIAVQNANLFTEIQKARAEVEAQALQTRSALTQSEKLFQMSSLLTQAADYQEMVKSIAETIGIPVINRITLDLFNYDLTNTLESADVAANWWNGTGSQPNAIGTHYTIETLRLMTIFTSPSPIFFTDTFSDERVDKASLKILKDLNIRAGAVVPLYAGTRQVGILIAQAGEPYEFKPEEIRLFTALAPQITTVVENRRQFERAQQRAQRESTLNTISQKIQNATTVEAVLQIAVREIGHVLGTEMTVAQLSMKDSRQTQVQENFSS